LSGIFLSHSSQDKDLATKLACDLTLAGFDVWFDSWAVEIGDSLYDRVFQGIDDSTFLVLCLSPSSVESQWISDELDAALAKEEKLGRRVILPVLLAECELPSTIKGRMLADISREYLKGLEDLKQALRRSGADKALGKFSTKLLPLRLRHGLYLERVELQRYFDQRLATAIQDGAELDTRQVLVMPDDRLDQMRSIFRTTVDQIESHTAYTPELENHFRQLYGRIERLDEGIRQGVADIANGLVAMNGWACFSEACFWFLQIGRHQVLHILAEVWKSSREDSPPPLGEDAIAAPLSNGNRASRMYDVADVVSCDIFRESGEYIKIWVGSDCDIRNRLIPQIPEGLRSLAPEPSFYDKYLVPQMVAGHRLWSSGPLIWDLPGSWVARIA